MFSTVAIHRRRRVGVDFLYIYIYIYTWKLSSSSAAVVRKNSKHVYFRVYYNMYFARRRKDVFAILPFVQIYLTTRIVYTGWFLFYREPSYISWVTVFILFFCFSNVFCTFYSIFSLPSLVRSSHSSTFDL